MLWVWLRPATSSSVRTPVVRMPVGPLPSQTAVAALTPLPHTITRLDLATAERNPFAPIAAPEPAPPAVTPVQPAPVPEPSAPPLSAEFSGRVTAPDGQVTVYARVGGQDVLLAPGAQLPNGYQVVAITDQAVEFRHPALKGSQRMELPPAPAYEVR